MFFMGSLPLGRRFNQIHTQRVYSRHICINYIHTHTELSVRVCVLTLCTCLHFYFALATFFFVLFLFNMQAEWIKNPRQRSLPRLPQKGTPLSHCVSVWERVLCLSACDCGPLKVTEFPFNLETPQLLCQIIISTVILFRFSFAAFAKSIYLFIAVESNFS